MQKPHLILSSGVDDTPENREIVKSLKMLAAKDGCSFSKLLWTAAMEYYLQHSPGNPQLILGHWTRNQPLPQSVREAKHHPEPDPMEEARQLSTDELIRVLARMEKADRRSERRTSIEMLLYWMIPQ